MPRITTVNMDEAREALSVHWGAIFAGLFVTLLVYLATMSLGLAVGVGTVRSVIQGQNSLRAASAGAGLWTVFSVLFSLFLGSYTSGRVSGIVATRVGYTQGAVITSLFFIVILSQIGIAMGLLNRGISGLSSAAIEASAEAAHNPQVTAVVEDAIGDLKFNVPPDTVVSGVVSRLVRGDTVSAKNYLVAVSGISTPRAMARLDSMVDHFKSVWEDVAQRSVDTFTMLAWSTFVTIVLGSITGMLGGATGALVNWRKPFDRVDHKALKRPAYT